MNSIHINIWLSGSLIVCGGFGRDEKTITQILSPTAQWKGLTEVQRCNIWLHLSLPSWFVILNECLLYIMPAQVAYNSTRASKNDQQKDSLKSDRIEILMGTQKKRKNELYLQTSLFGISEVQMKENMDYLVLSMWHLFEDGKLVPNSTAFLRDLTFENLVMLRSVRVEYTCLINLDAGLDKTMCWM